MIWKEPIFKHRTLSEWIENNPLPIGIENLVANAEPPKNMGNILRGILVITPLIESEDVVVGVLKSLKNHADEILCCTSFQVLDGLAQRRSRGRSNVPADFLETPDLLIIYDVEHLESYDEKNIDRALVARGMRPPKVTIIIGDTKGFSSTRKSYGADRFYEFRSKTSKKSS